jgi:hypothetical protein
VGTISKALATRFPAHGQKRLGGDCCFRLLAQVEVTLSRVLVSMHGGSGAPRRARGYEELLNWSPPTIRRLGMFSSAFSMAACHLPGSSSKVSA